MISNQLNYNVMFHSNYLAICISEEKHIINLHMKSQHAFLQLKIIIIK